MISVFIVCDADGIAQKSTFLDISGLVHDPILLGMLDAAPLVIGTGENVDTLLDRYRDDIAILQTRCPSVAILSHDWQADELVTRLTKRADADFRVSICANANIYRRLIGIHCDMALYVISPMQRNATYSRDGWKEGETVLVYDAAGAEYHLTEYTMDSALDLSESAFDDEIAMLEEDLNASQSRMDADADKELDMIVENILAGWKLEQRLSGKSPSDYHGDADDSADDDDNDDDNDGRIDEQLDRMRTVNEVILRNQELISNTMLSLSKHIVALESELAKTRSQLARMASLARSVHDSHK